MSPTLAVDLATLIRDNTEIAATRLVPELKLHLASDITPLWQLTEAELEQANLPPPYWAFAWPGSQALARLILDQPHWVRGHNVLDFAAGSGLAGLAAAWAGAALVTANDIDAVAIAAITLNADVNDLTIAIAGDDLTAAAPLTRWDVVLAGDVCYERPMTERIWPWLTALARAGTIVLMADPGRAYLPSAGLEEIARYPVPTLLAVEDREERMTRVFRLTAKP